MEGHWTYSRTYVLVLQVSLRLFNLDCRYPRDLLQPASKKRKHATNEFIGKSLRKALAREREGVSVDNFTGMGVEIARDAGAVIGAQG